MKTTPQTARAGAAEELTRRARAFVDSLTPEQARAFVDRERQKFEERALGDATAIQPEVT